MARVVPAAASDLQALRREHGALRGKVESIERLVLETAHRGSADVPVVNVQASAPMKCPPCRGAGRKGRAQLSCWACGGTGVAKAQVQEIVVRVAR